MLYKKSNILLIIILSLIAGTSVSGAPTISDYHKNFGSYVVPQVSGAQSLYVPEMSEIREHSNSQMAAIGAEILSPPANPTDLQPIGARTLPPVPATLFMVLTGFLCVSLFKDRKTWLAALSGILWAGQAGIQIIPQVAVNISKKHTQWKSPVVSACLHRFEDSCRLRSDIEGTKYIGLLNHLAGIPDSTMSLPLPTSLSSLPAQRSNFITPLQHLLFAQAKSNSASPQFAIIHISSLIIDTVNCLASGAEQDIRFSPGFIFENLPRGPPKPF